MPTIEIDLGTEHYASNEEIPEAAFGAEYLGRRIFRDEGNDFVPSVQEQIGYHHLRWPGDQVELRENVANEENGSPSEIEIYGFEFPDFVNPLYVRNNGETREGLTEMFFFANEQNLSFAMVAPTVRYVEMEQNEPGSGISQAVVDLRSFLERLNDEEFGPVPEDFTIELGSEYYGTAPYLNSLPDSNEVVAQFGDVSAAMAATIAQFESQNDIEINVAVQLGRLSNFDNDILIERFLEFDVGTLLDDNGHLLFDDPDQSALQGVDSVIWHRYVTRFDGINNGLWDPISLTDENGNEVSRTVEGLLEAWHDVVGRSLDLVAGFSAPSLNGAGDDNAGFGPLKPEHLEESLTYILEITTGLLAAGMDIGSLYGVGSGSFGTYAFQDQVFIGGELWRLMAESLPGTHVVHGFEENMSPFEREYDENDNLIDMHPVVSDHVNNYVFEKEDKIVIFLVAKDFEGESLDYEILFDLEDFPMEQNDGFPTLETTHLWAGEDFVDNWGQNIAVYGETRVEYPQMVRTGEGYSLNVTFENDYEAIRVVIDRGTSEVVSQSDQRIIACEMPSVYPIDEFEFVRQPKQINPEPMQADLAPVEHFYTATKNKDIITQEESPWLLDLESASVDWEVDVFAIA